MVMKKYVEADRRLKRVFQGIWDVLLEDIVVLKLGCKLTNQEVEDVTQCGTPFKKCEMRMKSIDERGTWNACLCETQGTTRKAYFLAEKKGYTFYPLGCLRLALAEATEIKGTIWTSSQLRRMRGILYGKKV